MLIMFTPVIVSFRTHLRTGTQEISAVDERGNVQESAAEQEDKAGRCELQY